MNIKTIVYRLTYAILLGSVCGLLVVVILGLVEFGKIW
jgi:hypothetical protein